jgi:hypothetical protein
VNAIAPARRLRSRGGIGLIAASRGVDICLNRGYGATAVRSIARPRARRPTWYRERYHKRHTTGDGDESARLHHLFNHSIVHLNSQIGTLRDTSRSGGLGGSWSRNVNSYFLILNYLPTR